MITTLAKTFGIAAVLAGLGLAGAAGASAEATHLTIEPRTTISALGNDWDDDWDDDWFVGQNGGWWEDDWDDDDRDDDDDWDDD